MGEEDSKFTIQTVEKLPKVAVKDKVVFNKTDGFFYLGVDIEKEEETNGDNLEKTSI